MCVIQRGDGAIKSSDKWEVGAQVTAWQAQGGGFTSKGTVPQCPSKVSRACLVLVTRFSQKSSSPDKSIATDGFGGKCQALSLETVEKRAFCPLVLIKSVL